MRMLRLVSMAATALIVSVGILRLSHQAGLAQQEADCPNLLETSRENALQACAGIAPGQVCLGSGPLRLIAEEGENPTFAETGDTISTAAIRSLETTAADPGTGSWGIALLHTTADLPPDTAQGMTMILFGQARIDNLVDPNAEPAPTIVLRNSAGYPVNLRGGAGTNFPVTGTLNENIDVLADGINSARDWYRIQSATGPAWVYRDLITIVQDESSNLTTLADDDISRTFTAPLQAMALHTGSDDSTCGAGTSGLLLQLAGDTTAHIQINGVDLAFSRATLLVQSPADQAMNILVLDGSANIKANGGNLTADASSWVELTLDGESPPLLHQSYAFASIEGTPVDLLPDGMQCMTGILSGEGEITLYTGPGDNYSPLATMDDTLHYTVIGQNADAEGAAWWQIDMAGYARAWVPQNTVRTIGRCSGVIEASVPPLNSAPSGGQTSGLVPAGQSVWQTDPGPDNLSGTCTQPPMALCAHLAAIQMNGDGSLSWRGQDLTPYTLYPAGENTFSYNGRNILNNGNVQITLTFTSNSTWIMTMSTVFDNDPGCTHTLNYTAARNW